MRAFCSDHFVLPLPEGHKFPMAKYSRLRERILRDIGVFAGSAAQHDDMTMVLLRVDEVVEPASVAV